MDIAVSCTGLLMSLCSVWYCGVRDHVEGPCDQSTLQLLPMPQAEENLVKFKIFWGSLSS